MLSGRIALVTGASSGIGAGLAVMLGDLGVHVVLAGRNAERLSSVASEIENMGGETTAVVVDLLNRDQVGHLVTDVNDAIGPIDILVNCAGAANSLRPIHECDMKVWDAEFEVNLRAPAALCSAVLPSMRARRTGYIVNICSESGIAITRGMGAYCVSKHGLRVLTQLIQEENQELGVRAWAICPGEVATPMADWENGISDRFLAVKDVVDLVHFLLMQGVNVKMGPEIPIRTTLNPFEGTSREHDGSLT